MSSWAVFVHGEKWPLLHVHAATMDDALMVAGARLRDMHNKRQRDEDNASPLTATGVSGGSSRLEDVRLVLMPGDGR